jgi:two-component system cell cycle response regulator
MNDDKTTQKSSLDTIKKNLEKSKDKHACLVTIHGPHMGTKIDLYKDKFTIGRSEDMDIIIDDDCVSGEHAVIIKKDNNFIIEDNNSPNGTFINTQRITNWTLRDQDLILIGNTIFKFISNENLENTYHEELYRLATTDCLLNIYNRNYFLENLTKELSRSRRYKRNLSLVMFDIDHFKQINDIYGHQAGDFILQKIAKIVKSHLRREDTFARYGGEEFIIILPETNVLQAAITSEKLRKIIEKTHFNYQDVTISLTISLGISSYKPGRTAKSPRDLIEKADKAMCQAKKTGRNKVVCTDRI